MRVGIYNYHLGKNQTSNMFENPKIAIGDDLMKPFQILRDVFQKAWHELCSVADYPMESFDAVLFMEWPTLPWILNPYFREARKLRKKMYLLLMESEIIRPSNFRKRNHRYFEKVFTWKDSIVDNKKYIKICVPQNLPDTLVFVPVEWRKFCTLISSHKLHNHPFELYSERIRAIRFFEANASQDFDLYGAGWGSVAFSSGFMRFASIVPGFQYVRAFSQRFFFHPFPSWKGKVDSKYETLSRYKFAICYENAKSIPGYITEKIFDCFFAGCIPVYLGPPNIDEFIPRNTYIDKNQFPTYQDLYSYLQTLSNEEISRYQENIKIFLQSSMGKRFSSEKFSNILFNNII